jgi:glycosyltransferase involved in cell wall biosynthesis
LKIAFLIGEIKINAGQTNNIIEVVNYLNKYFRNCEITIYTPKIGETESELFLNSRVDVKKINEYYRCLVFRKKLSNDLKQYDVIYVKGSFPYVYPATKSGKPNILVLHHMDSPKLFPMVSKKIRIIAANFLTGFVIRKPTEVITVSEELGQFYKQKYGRNVHVVEDQISDIFFEPFHRTFPSSKDEVRLLSVGYWDGYNGRKRQHILLSYFKDVLSVYKNAHLFLVGLGESEISELNKITKFLGISNNVSLEGYLPLEELRSMYLSEHIYVTATTFEGFYRQEVEAMAMGMPVLAFDSREIVKNLSATASVNHVMKSNAGKLFKDSKSMIKGIKEILEQYETLSTNGKTYAIRYSSEVVGKRSAELIEKLVNNGA